MEFDKLTIISEGLALASHERAWCGKLFIIKSYIYTIDAST